MSGVNWTDLKKTADDATKPLPNDWYDVVVKKAEYKVAGTGADMIATQFVVDSGPYGGRTLFTNIVLTPDSPMAMNFFFQRMAALGVDGNFFSQLSASGLDMAASLTAIAEAIKGRALRVKTDIRKWQGQDRNDIVEMTAATTSPGGLPGAQAAAVPNLGPAGGPPVPPAGPVGGPPVPPASGTSAPVPATDVPAGPPLPF